MAQAAVRVSRLSRTATSSTAVALAPLHDNLALAPVRLNLVYCIVSHLCCNLCGQWYVASCTEGPVLAAA